MLQKRLILCALFLLSAVAVVYWKQVALSPEAIEQYKLLKEHEKRAPRSPSSSVQLSENIKKELFLPQRDVHLTLQAERSELRLEERQEKNELCERLYHLSCSIEEKGTLHQLQAEEGLYFYPSLEMRCQGAIRYIGGEPNPVALLADELVYHPARSSIDLLSTQETRRVLLQSDALQLSAPALRFFFSPTKQIQGLGDVHLSFDREEIGLIDTFLRSFRDE